MAPSVAIVGSGPSGLYAAAAIAKARPTVRVDVIERLPTPFGLVRYGVAPDHQKIKQVEKALSRVFDSNAARFCGNVEIGTSVSLDELQHLYDVVLVACGAPKDRPLGIPGENLPGVYGSAAFVAWYNGHPDFPVGVSPPERWIGLDAREVAIIGAGNVALDLARVLSLARGEIDATDLPPPVGALVASAPIETIHVLARRGPLQAKFAPAELREMGRLEDATAWVDPRQLPSDAALATVAAEERTAKGKNIALFREFADAANAKKARRSVRFHFLWSPTEIRGDDRVRSLVLNRNVLREGRAVATDERWELPVGLILSAIGYRTAVLDGMPGGGNDAYANDDGHVRDNLWVTGWARRGPSGTIATNRSDAHEVVVSLLGRLDGAAGHREGAAGFDRLCATRGIPVVSYQQWKRIDAAERAAAPGSSPRRKLVERSELLRAAHGPRSD